MPRLPSGEQHLTTGLPLDGKRAFVWSFLIEALHEGRSSSRGEGAARGPHLERCGTRSRGSSAPAAEKKLEETLGQVSVLMHSESVMCPG